MFLPEPQLLSSYRILINQITLHCSGVAMKTILLVAIGIAVALVTIYQEPARLIYAVAIWLCYLGLNLK